ncbi:hypothetical protein AVEN_224407-1, partial [Araneus ventricosus]
KMRSANVFCKLGLVRPGHDCDYKKTLRNPLLSKGIPRPSVCTMEYHWNQKDSSDD